jgi:hypothetical protein
MTHLKKHGSISVSLHVGHMSKYKITTILSKRSQINYYRSTFLLYSVWIRMKYYPFGTIQKVLFLKVIFVPRITFWSRKYLIIRVNFSISVLANTCTVSWSAIMWIDYLMQAGALRIKSITNRNSLSTNIEQIRKYVLQNSVVGFWSRKYLIIRANFSISVLANTCTVSWSAIINIWPPRLHRL